jgi:hypothetical protein
MTSKIQALEQEWLDAVATLKNRVTALREEVKWDTATINRLVLPERVALKEAHTALMDARNQVTFSMRIVAPSQEDALNMKGWIHPRCITLHIGGRKVQNGLSYALTVRGYLRNHELTEGWDGVDL